MGAGFTLLCVKLATFGTGPLSKAKLLPFSLRRFTSST